MPLHKHGGRLVVRSGNVGPSPFLVKTTPYLRKVASVARTRLHAPRAIDIGCGNGRNSEHLKSLGFDVLSFDIKPDYGNPLEMGPRTRLPVFDASVNVVLLQYVLMFMDDATVLNVLRQCHRACTWPGVFVVELCAVKHSRCLEPADADDLQDEILSRFGKLGWLAPFKRRHHFVLSNMPA